VSWCRHLGGIINVGEEINMRKKAFLLGIMISLLSLVLWGCGGDAQKIFPQYHRALLLCQPWRSGR